MDMEVLEMEQFPLFEDLAVLDEVDSSTISPEYEDNGEKYFPGNDPAPKLVIDQAGKEVLDELLLLSQDDPLDLDWMETGSLEQFLEGMGAGQNTPTTQEVEKASEPIIVIKDTNVNHSVLHDLLTQPITIKQSPPVRVSPTPVVQQELSHLDLLDESVHLTSLQSVAASSSSDMIEVPAEISFDSGYGVTSLNTSSSSQHDLLDVGSVDSLISSPLSAEEIDSLLSGSEPSSPSSQSDGNDPDYSPQQSDDEDYKPKSRSSGKQKTKQRRSGPYSTTAENRKDRKRDQNKNAAIRYRNKKREEADVLKKEEEKLAEKNKELNDKVSQLTREITYMKDLISEVCKAKGLKVTFKNKSH
ncbi:uncharacterized protein LOC133175107 [Saccostrea echinata]|uniref:uncharacterized protein LOC133175107 n=1 Tax=Saccostrea echinata TaxID=191078 RepID=UPI002A802C3F|nr:uncharacterized protein LOC133175107 [Saccostrea echinata]